MTAVVKSTRVQGFFTIASISEFGIPAWELGVFATAKRPEWESLEFELLEYLEIIMRRDLKLESLESELREYLEIIVRRDPKFELLEFCVIILRRDVMHQPAENARSASIPERWHRDLGPELVPPEDGSGRGARRPWQSLSLTPGHSLPFSG